MSPTWIAEARRACSVQLPLPLRRTRKQVHPGRRDREEPLVHRDRDAVRVRVRVLVQRGDVM